MIIDSHCHYNLMPIADDWQTRWQAAQDVGVTASVVVGTSVDSSQFAVYLAGKEKNFFPTVGLHPYVIGELVRAQPEAKPQALYEQCDQWLIRIEQMAKLPTVVAIGEVGFDFFRIEANANRDLIIQLQTHILERQLALAAKLSKPVIFHVRDTEEAAYWQTLNAIKKAKLTAPFVLHCVSGPTAYIQEALAIGGYLGVAGNVTYKSADTIRALVQSGPKDRVVLETDAPFLPPHPHRGKVCEPAMIQLTAEYVEQQFGISPDQAAQNTQLLFQLPIR